ncbi:rCG33529, isoform CRA_b [Rattus norvegicus]|uniref:RCG33529, isoform CRA_b n=2 Tax=Rattus norvegicus TaxID=10116 RepID=A6HIL4_RAT|nr:CDGSH iron-sulfur domain-containing protein 3, mitochondrial [Rattus norvegicus]EDM05868.1 rCG33529, isoform CRA_b [Rattus norvegicus]|eukprot:NP_001099305.1 CDGSH iron-sulfur domain-containing protein 3, mitochondrial [Rattus norvegicus]
MGFRCLPFSTDRIFLFPNHICLSALTKLCQRREISSWLARWFPKDPAKPVVAQKTPIRLELVAGKTYRWCVCGRSKNQSSLCRSLSLSFWRTLPHFPVLCGWDEKPSSEGLLCGLWTALLRWLPLLPAHWPFPTQVQGRRDTHSGPLYLQGHSAAPLL